MKNQTATNTQSTHEKPRYPLWLYETMLDEQAPELPLVLTFVTRLGVQFPTSVAEVADSVFPLPEHYLDILERMILVKPERLKLMFRKMVDYIEPLSKHFPSPAQVNVQRIGEWLGLNPVERDLLLLVVWINGNERLERTVEAMNSRNERMDTGRLIRILSVMSGHPHSVLVEALRPNSLLCRSGLVNANRFSFMPTRLTPHSSLTQMLSDPDLTKDRFLARFFQPAPEPQLAQGDFAHVAVHFESVTKYLREVLRQKSVGCNILLYGPPGTGKTQFALAACRAAQANTYLVNVLDDNGEEASPHERWTSYGMAQHMLERDPSVVIFDEIEDVFPTDDHHRHSGPAGKGWLVHTLEKNPTPTIWISNKVAHIDPALLRRIDLVLHLDQPGQRARKEISSRLLKNTPANEAFVESITSAPKLSPAHIERVARVANLISGGEVEQWQDTAIHLVDQTLKVIDQPPVQRPKATAALRFDASLLNTSHDAEQIVALMKRASRPRLLCYGPPGTGKTAFARHIGDLTDRTIHLISPSDILSRYVGDNEANLRQWFATAEANDDILILDEIDTLAANRDNANSQWESSLVNELLVRLENSRCLVMATTNRYQALDPALLRRMDLKIEFRPLASRQIRSLLEQLLASLDLPAQGLDTLDVNSLNGLTFGDVAVVQRQAELFANMTTCEEVFDALMDEIAARSPRQPIGFR